MGLACKAFAPGQGSTNRKIRQKWRHCEWNVRKRLWPVAACRLEHTGKAGREQARRWTVSPDFRPGLLR